VNFARLIAILGKDALQQSDVGIGVVVGVGEINSNQWPTPTSDADVRKPRVPFARTSRY
jgi:hypothetical protein